MISGMKMMARIQAIAADGLRLAEINTAASTIKTCGSQQPVTIFPPGALTERRAAESLRFAPPRRAPE